VKLRDLDVEDWAIIVVGSLFMSIMVFGIVWHAYTERVEDGRKQDCRLAGGTIIFGERHGDWNCSGIKPVVERP
jgi:hypothetical protein